MVSELKERAESNDVARQIARTAARLFATRGYAATSVREIVEAAGFKKPTLYYHFGSKEGLAQALLQTPLAGLAETFRAIAAGDGPAVERLVGLIEAHFDFCREDPDRARFYYAICFGPLGADLAAELMKFYVPLAQPISDVIARMADEGTVDPARAARFDWACRGLLTSAVMDFLYKDRDFEPGLARRVVCDLLRGFGEPGSPGGSDRA